MLTTTYPIDPLTITFGQLRSILPYTAGLCLPAADELEQREQGVLFAHELSNLTVTVFCDGFFLWRDSARSASYAVDRCSRLHLKNADGMIMEVHARDFYNAPCLIPLIMAGDVAMEREPSDYEFYWQEFISSRGNC